MVCLTLPLFHERAAIIYEPLGLSTNMCPSPPLLNVYIYYKDIAARAIFVSVEMGMHLIYRRDSYMRRSHTVSAF